MPQIGHTSEIGHFMNHDIRFGGSYGSANGRRIEAVGHDGFRAHSIDCLRLCWRTRKSDNGVTCRDQRGNKWTTDGAGGACNKNSHGETLTFAATARQIVRPNLNSSAQMWRLNAASADAPAVIALT